MSTYLPSSGPMALSQVASLFGGPASPSLSNYYRGAGYVPGSKVVGVTERTPTSGDYYDPDVNYVWYWFQTGSKFIQWAGATIVSDSVNLSDGGSYTVGSTTYYSGTLYYHVAGPYGTWNNKYGVYKIYSTSNTVLINQGVPTSGTFAMSQLYGAEKP